MKVDSLGLLLIGTIVIAYIKHRSCTRNQSKPSPPSSKPGPSAQTEVEPNRWRSFDVSQGNRLPLEQDPVVDEVLAFGNTL